ncbi:DUF1439 domain-containing protein [Piscinibacter sakaiensis]|uniref:DUF1439 domain-containing protein n=1 Tax=Piscinibacter sakaiensis TaxID=1547922 RepID=UPI003AAA9441
MTNMARLALLLSVSVLAACTTLAGPRSIVVSDAELSRRLAEKFPIDRRWLEVFDVRMSNPQVRTSSETGLLSIDVDLGFGGRLIDRRYAARLRLQARPRFDEQDHSLRLSNVDVDALQIAGDGESLLGRAGRLPALLLAQSLEDATVYRLNAEQIARLQQHGMALRSIGIGSQGGLQLNFEPLR